MTLALASRSAAAATIFNAATVPSLTPSTSFSRSGAAAMTSAKLPKRAISAFAKRLGVALRNRQEQQKFQKLVIGERIRPAGKEALAQPLAMAVIMRNVAVPRRALRSRAARASLWARA